MDIKDKFSEIKQAYRSYEGELLSQEKNLFWNTEKGIYGTSNMDNVFEFFKKIKLDGYKKFLDLGCGEGRIVLIASLFTQAVGIEYDEELVRKGIEVRDRLGIDASRCELICGDYMQHDLSQYDMIFINPDKGFMWGLDNKLSLELKGELWVYNMVFAPNALKKGPKIWVNQVPITKYTNK